MHKYSDSEAMPFKFRITFPGNQQVTLCALTKTEADDMVRALTVLRADYVIVGRRWIECSLGLTAESHEILDRLIPVREQALECS
jgi:hypothetical protein